jgi:hypothetical protein
MERDMSCLGKASLLVGTLLLGAALAWAMPFFKGVETFVVSTLLWMLSLFIPIVILVVSIEDILGKRKRSQGSSDRHDDPLRPTVRVGFGCYICTMYDAYERSTESGVRKTEFFGTRPLNLPRPASGFGPIELVCACCRKNVVLQVMSAEAERRRIWKAKVAGTILLLPSVSVFVYWLTHWSWIGNFIFAIIWWLGNIVIAFVISTCLHGIFGRRLDSLSLVMIAEDTPAVVIAVEHAQANGFLNEKEVQEIHALNNIDYLRLRKQNCGPGERNNQALSDEKRIDFSM